MTLEAAALAPLLSPLSIRSLSVANRFVMSPMTRSFATTGIPGPDIASYYRRRAEGGVGLIITEGVGVPHAAAIGYSGVDVERVPNLFGDAALTGWKRVVDEVHAAGGKIVPQLWHQGPMRLDGTGASPEAPSMRPSGIWGPADGNCTVLRSYVERAIAETRPMTESEIGDVIDSYRQAAANAKALSFDGVALHGAHGYLIDSFLWNETNRRTDRWGGDLQRRSAFAAAVVAAIREEIGDGLPIFFRWSQWKQQDYGARLVATAAELETVLAPLVSAGVDVFDVSTRDFDQPAFDGSPLSLAGWTRKLTDRPTMAVGSVGLSKGLYDGYAVAEPADNLARLLHRYDEGEFDLVGVGRMLITHADWVERVRQGLPVAKFDRSALANLI